MGKVLKAFAEFRAPGIIVSEEWRREIGPDTLAESVEWPESAYSFRIIHRCDVVDGSEVYKGQEHQVGPEYYHPDSEIMTYRQAETDSRASNILRVNMRSNKWDAVIFTRWGNWPQPYDSESIKILESEATE